MLREFLSEENIALHKEYARQIRLKYSILEASLKELTGAGVKDLYRLKLDDRDRADALELLPQIILHDVFFSSFCECRYPRSVLVSSVYGSESAFLNRLYKAAEGAQFGFLIIGRGASYSVVTDYKRALRYDEPLLAVDLCEHAYFLDYGFDRERYLVSALSHLDLKKITI